MEARDVLRGVAVSALIVVLGGCGSTKGGVRGTVVRSNGTPVAKTRVTIATASAITDAHGTFSLKGLKRGRQRLSIAYSVSGVFRCRVALEVDVRAGKTVERRFTVPIVKVGRGCRTLADPVAAYLCRAARWPIALYTLPPYDLEDYTAGYRQIGGVSETGCPRLVIEGRVRIPSYLSTVYDPFPWLYVSDGRTRGWILPQRAQEVEPQVRAWARIAIAKIKRLPVRAPRLPGNDLPDLALTTPRPALRVGESCTKGQIYANGWLVGLRNVGHGLAPKVLAVYISNGYQTEMRHLGDPIWTRGLAPGEAIPIDDLHASDPPGHTFLGLSAFARVNLDPANAIRESNEQNNSVKLGYVPTLTCGAP
jgi:hypothetical protein